MKRGERADRVAYKAAYSHSMVPGGLDVTS